MYVSLVGWLVCLLFPMFLCASEWVLCGFDFSNFYCVRYCCQSNTECAQSSEANAAIQRGYNTTQVFLSFSVCVLNIYDIVQHIYLFIYFSRSLSHSSHFGSLGSLRSLTSLFIHKLLFFCLYRAKSNNNYDVDDDDDDDNYHDHDHDEKNNNNIHAYNHIFSTRRHRLKL